MRIVLACALFLAFACGDSEIHVTDDVTTTAAANADGAATSSPGVATSPIDKGDGCLVEIVQSGSGRIVKLGDEVLLHYAVLLEDADRPVASTVGWLEPLRLTLNPATLDGLMRGLARGIEGLNAGTRARIELPPALAYGRDGLPSAGIPPDATLTVEVEIVGVR